MAHAVNEACRYVHALGEQTSLSLDKRKAYHGEQDISETHIEEYDTPWISASTFRHSTSTLTSYSAGLSSAFAHTPKQHCVSTVDQIQQALSISSTPAQSCTVANPTMQPTTFGLASLLAGTTLSAPAVLTPLSKRGDPIASNTQSCWSKQGGHGIAYHVHVGEPWDAGSGCKDIKAALDNAQVQFNTLGWTCGDDGYGT